MNIKICGITNFDDAARAVDCGADLLGFIFYPASPRYVSPEAVGAIISNLPVNVETVGVFVDETTANMLSVARLAGVHTLQLHGREPPEQMRELTGLNLLKAVTLTSSEDLQNLEIYTPYTLLVDTPSPVHGGSGRTGDWELARAAGESHRIFLAGGLNADNVAAAVATVQPCGVDVSSGVESSKGIKDHGKIKAFIDAVRSAAGVET